MTTNLTEPGLELRVAIAAATGGALVLIMLAITLWNGTGYQDFESILRYGTAGAYGEAIASAAPVLRAIYPFDTIYIFSYVTMVFAMAQIVPERRAAGLVSMILVLATAGLDFLENNHILALASAAERGSPPEMGGITFQTLVTQTKFNCGLLLTLSLSFLIPGEGRLAQVTRWLPRVAVVTGPVAILSPATVLIYLSMNIGLAAMLTMLYARLRAPRMAGAGRASPVAG